MERDDTTVKNVKREREKTERGEDGRSWRGRTSLSSVKKTEGAKLSCSPPTMCECVFFEGVCL